MSSATNDLPEQANSGGLHWTINRRNSIHIYLALYKLNLFSLRITLYHTQALPQLTAWFINIFYPSIMIALPSKQQYSKLHIYSMSKDSLVQPSSQKCHHAIMDDELITRQTW